MSTENPNAFKHKINGALLDRIANAIAKEYPSFNRFSFIQIESELQSLELKPRVRRICSELKKCLPSDYPKALKILTRSASQGTLEGFDLWPYTEFIQTYGLEHVNESLEALKKLTPLFTSEFAVRPFLKKHPKITLPFLQKCTQSPDPHVRRWVSEGTRSRLPWGERLEPFIQDPAPTLKLVEALKYDSELYVRKSVANHLNDLGKDHPMILVKTLERWNQNLPQKAAQNIQWITRHALRTLIKQGNPAALKLIGADSKSTVKVSGFALTPETAKVGQAIQFQLKVQSTSPQPQKLVVDYIVHFVCANGRLSAKVFKLKTFTLEAKKEILISKTHSLRKITTRKYYSGKHALEIQINGKIYAQSHWFLNCSL